MKKCMGFVNIATSILRWDKIQLDNWVENGAISISKWVKILLILMGLWGIILVYSKNWGFYCIFQLTHVLNIFFGTLDKNLIIFFPFHWPKNTNYEELYGDYLMIHEGNVLRGTVNCSDATLSMIKLVKMPWTIVSFTIFLYFNSKA